VTTDSYAYDVRTGGGKDQEDGRTGGGKDQEDARRKRQDQVMTKRKHAAACE